MIRAVLDADVLYPLPLRDTLLWAAVEGCFHPLWTDEILEEAIRNLIADGRMDAAAAKRMRTALAFSFGDAWVKGHHLLVSKMLNHPKDRHVAACAIKGGADVIVTGNGRDFRELPVPIRAVSPDQFLCRLLNEDPARIRAALSSQSAQLRAPPMSIDDILGALVNIAPAFVVAFRSIPG